MCFLAVRLHALFIIPLDKDHYLSTVCWHCKLQTPVQVRRLTWDDIALCRDDKTFHTGIQIINVITRCPTFMAISVFKRPKDSNNTSSFLFSFLPAFLPYFLISFLLSAHTGWLMTTHVKVINFGTFLVVYLQKSSISICLNELLSQSGELWYFIGKVYWCFCFI